MRCVQARCEAPLDPDADEDGGRRADGGDHLAVDAATGGSVSADAAMDASPAGDGGSADAATADDVVDAGIADAGIADAAVDSGLAVPIDGGSDAGNPPPVAAEPPPVGVGPSLGALEPADFSCRYRTREPTSRGASRSLPFTVEDFASGSAVAGLNVNVFAANDPSTDGSCGAGCFAGVADAAGRFNVSEVPGTWMGYRVRPGMGTASGTQASYVELVQTNLLVTTSGASLLAVRRSDLDAMHAVVGSTPTAGRSATYTRFTDCNGAPVANARVRVFGDHGEITLTGGGSAARAFYSYGSGIHASAWHTDVDGVAGTVNVPVSASRRVRVELWGKTSQGAPTTKLGCEQATLAVDGLTIIDVGPRRSNAPRGC